MSAVNYLNTISSALIGMITLSGIFVCGYHAIKMIQAEDYWAYGWSAKKLLKMQFADMMSIAGLLEVVDSLILIGETQQHELQGNVSDISTKLKNRAISIVDRWENFLDKDYEIRR